MYILLPVDGVPGNHQGECRGSEGCEIDHLISLEIGGSNDITNLWPQPFQGTWNAHMKDALENYFHKSMCDGTMSMSQVCEMDASPGSILKVYFRCKLKLVQTGFLRTRNTVRFRFVLFSVELFELCLCS